MIPMVMAPPAVPVPGAAQTEAPAGLGFEALLGAALVGPMATAAMPQVLCTDCATDDGVLPESVVLADAAAGEAAVLAIVLPPAPAPASSEPRSLGQVIESTVPVPSDLECDECSVLLLPVPEPAPVAVQSATPAVVKVVVVDQAAEAPAPVLSDQSPALPTEVAEPAATVQAPASTRFVERVERIVAQLELAGPPKSIVVDLPEFGGARITVSLRGSGVHLAFTGVVPGAIGDWMPELRRVLADRGLDFQGDAPGSDDGLWDDEQDDRRKPPDRQRGQ